MSVFPSESLSDNLFLSDDTFQTEIVITPHSNGLLATIADLQYEAQSYLDSSKAENTKQAYESDWQDFTARCSDRSIDPLPAAQEIVVLYLTDLAHRCKLSTMMRPVSTISKMQQAVELPNPTWHHLIRELLDGMRRKLPSTPEQKAPTLTDHVKAMIEGLPKKTSRGLQERALLLLGFAGAFRRSELVALNVADLKFSRAGLVVFIRRSKTDQIGEGMKKGIELGSSADTCPVRVLKAGYCQLTGLS